MKNSISLTVITLLLAVSSLSAATLYVSPESTNPTPPYTNWVTAATNIQQAVDVAATGDEVVVSNGVYSVGQMAVGRARSRVAIAKAITSLSVNGPQFTVTQGDSYSWIRCVYLTNGASLSGFTLTNGYSGGGVGGGVWCASTNDLLTNCVIVGNLAAEGGGAYGGTLYNCTLSGNMTEGNGSGGGAYDCTLNNCTLFCNGSEGGGGVYCCRDRKIGYSWRSG